MNNVSVDIMFPSELGESKRSNTTIMGLVKVKVVLMHNR